MFSLNRAPAMPPTFSMNKVFFVGLFKTDDVLVNTWWLMVIFSRLVFNSPEWGEITPLTTQIYIHESIY